MSVHVIAYAMANPGDTSELQRNLVRFEVSRVRRLALLVKTEGNSDVNDFSREFGMLSAQQALSRWGGESVAERATFLFSTGCEGAMTPFGYMFVDYDEAVEANANLRKALAIGCARSRSLTGDEIGTLTHADIVADTVRKAIQDASAMADDVALVIVKTPVMSHVPATENAKKNKRITSAYSKAVGALGAGIALGEVDRAKIVQEAFDTDLDLHSRRAMVFSGSELDCVEIMLLANRPGAGGNLYVETGQISDMLDADGIKSMLRSAGCKFDSEGRLIDPERVVAMLVKGGVAPDGRVRGNRTTVKTSHLDTDKHVRATLSGVVGSIMGSCRVFISANTVHQAPPGGGLCACIVKSL
ncbi:MAG: ring-opening amidohydrolase [Pseudolabrys sp.]